MKQIFTFQGPVPSKKNAQRMSRNGYVYKASSVRDYETSVAWELKAQKAKEVIGDIHIVITIVYEHNRQDLDGMEATLLDALQYGGLYKNDRAVVKKYSEKRRINKELGERPHTVVIIDSV